MNAERKDRAESEQAAFLSRRSFVSKTGILAAVAALAHLPAVLRERGWLNEAKAASPDLVHETLNGVIAFVVPGPDPYSATQGLRAPDPGGIDANITDALIKTIDQALPAPPPFPSLSYMVSVILNQVAQGINPSVSGPFLSPFANLTFQEKSAVFGYIESGANPALSAIAPLAGLLFIVVALLAYSEAGVFNPQTRKLTGTPVGWTITGYGGVVRGQDEFKGYFQNRRQVDVAMNDRAHQQERGDYA